MRFAQEVKPALLSGHLFGKFGIVHFYFLEYIASLLPFLLPILILLYRYFIGLVQSVVLKSDNLGHLSPIT